MPQLNEDASRGLARASVGNVTTLPVIDAQDVFSLMSPAEAVTALSGLLRLGFDVSADAPRYSPPAGDGQFLLMPSVRRQFAGVKVLTVAPPGADVRIKGVYVLVDASSLAFRAIIDGRALTALRTAAVSGIFVDQCVAQNVENLVVFGSGPQAIAHVATIAALRPVLNVSIISLDKNRAKQTADEICRYGLVARVGNNSDLRSASLIVCATTSSTPLFTTGDVPDSADVIAIGSHTPESRELPAKLFSNAFVVVEDIRVAQLEAGDIVLAESEGTFDINDCITLTNLVRDNRRPVSGQRCIYKGCGMSWQDAFLAQAIYDRYMKSAAEI